jgi:hypothetical protein
VDEDDHRKEDSDEDGDAEDDDEDNDGERQYKDDVGGANDELDGCEDQANFERGNDADENSQPRSEGGDIPRNDDDRGFNEGPQQHESSTNDDLSVDERTTCQYYVSTSGPLKSKSGVQDNIFVNSQDFDNLSLIDLCRIEKKNTLPEIPLLEEPIIFEE